MRNNVVWRVAQCLIWMGISLYLGGMVALGAVAAPSLFKTVRETQASTADWGGGAEGARQLGGEIFGNILRRFGAVEQVAVGMMGAGILVQAVYPMGRRKWDWLRAGLVAVVLGVGVYDWTVMTPLIWEERAAWREATSLDNKEAKLHEAEFDRLHVESERLGKVKVYLLLGLLVVQAWRGGPGKENTETQEMFSGT